MSREKIFPFLFDVFSFKKCFYDVCSGRRSTDAVVFQKFTQFFVFHLSSCGFHGSQQCSFCIWFWRRSSSLMHERFVFAFFAHCKFGNQLFFIFFFFFSRFFLVFGIDDAPTWLENLFSRCFEIDGSYLTFYQSIGNFTFWIENSYKTLCHQIID